MLHTACVWHSDSLSVCVCVCLCVSHAAVLQDMVRLKRGNEALTSELKKVKKKSAEDVRKMQVSLLEMRFHLKRFSG